MASKAKNTVTINTTHETLRVVLMEAIQNAKHRWQHIKEVYLESDKPNQVIKEILEGNHATLIRAQNMYRAHTGHYFLHGYKD